MDLNIDIESAHVLKDETTLFNVSGDVETLIHIILFTGHEATLFLIIDLFEDDEALGVLMESSGDVDTLNRIIELIESTEDSKRLNDQRTFSQDELDTVLMSVCRRGYTFLVNEIVYLGANVHTRDRNGNTPLLICAEKGFTNIAMLLIGRKVNINATNDFGDTALILATGLADSVKMAFLLLAQMEINVNHQNKEGYTALMKAIEARNVDVIKLLLHSQEDPKEGLEGVKNCRSETAQDIADKLGIGTAVKILTNYSIKVYHPLLAAVLICDLASFNMLMVCNAFEPFGKSFIIQDSFRAMFVKHEMSGDNFNKNEELIIQILLLNGADVNDCPDSSNPLLVAMRVGSGNVLQMLLKHADFCRLSKQTQEVMLVTSGEHGHAHIIEHLLKHNRNLATKSCTTPALISAMKHGHHNCIEMLIKYDASLDITFAFESAVNNIDSMCLKYLVENFKVGLNRAFSADSMKNFLLSAARNGHIDIIGILLDTGVSVNCVNSDSKTPLMEAKNAEVVNFLVQRGAVVSMNSTEHGLVYSPLLHVLSYQSESTDNMNIVEALLKHGAHVNVDPGYGSPLMLALLNRANQKIVQLLLDHGADVSVRDSRGNTIILIAAESNFTENIDYLLQHSDIRSMINEKNHVGWTALMISAGKGNHAAVKVLIDHGADVNLRDVAGNTAFMITVSSQIHEPEILTTLIHAGSDINEQNDGGYSPLMLAAEASCEEGLIFLVDSGADVNAVSESNETALSLLIDSPYPKPSSVECLLDHGARASYVKPEVVIWMILENQFDLIPKLMQHGLGPTEISSRFILPAFIPTVSPFCMAVATGNSKLASYFAENLFVTKSDMFKLIHNKNVRKHLIKYRLFRCAGFLDKQSAQPLSLFSLAFIAVQAAVGAAPGREDRVNMLPLPQIIKDRLMFKVESTPLEVSYSFIGMESMRNMYCRDKMYGDRRSAVVDDDSLPLCCESGSSADKDKMYVYSYEEYCSEIAKLQTSACL